MPADFSLVTYNTRGTWLIFDILMIAEKLEKVQRCIGEVSERKRGESECVEFGKCQKMKGNNWALSELEIISESKRG